MSAEASRWQRVKTALAVGSLVVAAVGTWVVVGDRARASARRVWVLNATATAATVEVGDEAVRVEPGGRGELFLPEGTHVARVARGDADAKDEVPLEEVPFELRGTFLERYLDRTVFVLNVDGAATLLLEQEEYGPAPAAERRAPELLVGEPFMAVPDVDYAFEPFPETVEGSQRVIVKTRLDLAPADAAQALRHLPPDDPRGLELAEAALDPARVDERLLADYVRRGRTLGELERVLGFLSARLWRDPSDDDGGGDDDGDAPSVPWHRATQDLLLARGDAAALDALRARYDARLAADPGAGPGADPAADLGADLGAGERGALLYLRGRLERGDAAARLDFYRRAVAADPGQPFASYALAVLLQRRGELAQARDHAATAAQARPQDPAMDELAFRLRFAAGEHEALLQETVERQRGAEIDLLLLKRRLELEAALGRTAGAREAAQAYRQRVQGLRAGDPSQLALHSELLLHDVLGDDARRRELAQEVRDPRVRDRIDFQACLGSGELEAAAALHAEGRLEPAAALFLCVAWQQRGDADQAARWRERAAADLAGGSPGEAAAAALLAGEAPATLDAVWDLALPVTGKAALLLALAEGRPDWALEARGLARTTRTFPYRLLTAE